MYLRQIGDNRIAGLLIPFRIKDKYHTWWDENSDLGLTLFQNRPVFHHHLLRGEWQRAGTLDDDTFEVRPDGLYVEAVLEANPAGVAVMDLVNRGVAAWSSGTLPHLMEVGEGGYVRKWAIVEGSVVHVDEAGSLPGTTTVSLVRGVVDVDAKDEDQFIRSIWVMDPTKQQNGSATVEQDSTQAALVATLEAMRQEIADLREQVQTVPPIRSVDGESTLPTQPQITVASKYDGVSLWGMLFRDEVQRLHAARNGKLHHRDEEFMRAAVDKMRRIRDGQSEDDPGIRAVDAPAFQAWHDKVPHLRANEAMQSTLAGSGDELVPTILSSVAHYEFRLASRVWGLLPSMMMPSQPYTMPSISGGPRFRRALEAADRSQISIENSRLADDKPTTSLITFSAGEIGVLSLVSQTLLEDSGISVADMLAQQFARNAARDIDYVLLNGDERTTTDNISHSADPTGSDWDMILTLDGLRRIAQSNSDSSSLTTVAADDVVTLAALMGSRGIIGLDIQNLVLVVDPGSMYKLVVLDDLKTVDQIGERATLLTGQVGSIYGIPVIVSDELEYGDANGKYAATHTGGTTGQWVLLHRRLNMVGYRRQLQTEMSRPPHTGMYAMSATVRMDLQPMEAGTVAWGYNVTV